MIVRLLRSLGWVILAGSVGVFVAVTIAEAAQGPEASQSLRLTARMWQSYRTSILMAAGATALAMTIAVPVAAGLVHARGPWRRGVLLALTILPLLTMPNVFTYSWMLLGSSPVGVIRAAMSTLGWNARGAAAFQAAWVLGTWLWPIPALLLMAGYRHIGARAHRLACLDATPVQAFVRGALPAMRPTILAAGAVVFVLVMTDSTVPALMTATDTWSYQVMTDARDAMRFARPAAFMFWRSWPMLATLVVMVAAAAPGLRQMASWGSAPESSEMGTASLSVRWIWPPAVALAAGLTVLPATVFVMELVIGRTSLEELMQRGFGVVGQAAAGTVIVAALAGLAAVLAALVTVGGSIGSRPSRVGSVVVIVLLGVATMPPELIATALVGCYARIGDPATWNLYDDTPWVWTAAMVARFAFIPACVAHLLDRRLGRETSAQAAVDGADRLQRIAYARLPMLWRPLAGAGLIVGCLAISEVACSVLVQPVRFFRGSLAVMIDNQMHYGREAMVIACSLLLMVPAAVTAVMIPWLAGLRRVGQTHAAPARP
ncbi:MAG: hypothetical protein ACE5F9_06175 [Phycisphaerae bacterium]